MDMMSVRLAWRPRGNRKTSSAIGAADHVHQFGNLLTLLNFVSGGDGMLHAMSHVIPQHFLFEFAQRGAHRGNLRDNIDAVAVLADHARDAAYLTFDAPETFLT